MCFTTGLLGGLTVSAAVLVDVVLGVAAGFCVNGDRVRVVTGLVVVLFFVLSVFKPVIK